jgi:drug/metabolite transporter (DMT)-like permease
MGHAWVFIALLSATGDALRDLTLKRVLTKENSLIITWLLFALPLPVLYLADYLHGIPKPAPGFYWTLAIALPLEILAQILYMQALRLSPLSIVAPLLSLSPVFMLIIPFLIIGETITPASGCGVLFIAGGAYALNSSSAQRGLLEPFRALLRERGAICMAAVAVLFSITATLSKKAIMLSSPLHYMAVYWTGIVIGMAPVALVAGRNNRRDPLFYRTLVKALPAALLFVTTVFAAAYAMGLAKVTYVTAIKRLSILFSIVLAGAILKEEAITERLIGGTLMLAGFVLIITGG